MIINRKGGEPPFQLTSTGSHVLGLVWLNSNVKAWAEEATAASKRRRGRGMVESAGQGGLLRATGV